MIPDLNGHLAGALPLSEAVAPTLARDSTIEQYTPPCVTPPPCRSSGLIVRLAQTRSDPASENFRPIGQSAWVSLTGDEGLDHIAGRTCISARGGGKSMPFPPLVFLTVSPRRGEVVRWSSESYS
jgi:hypothetical protein